MNGTELRRRRLLWRASHRGIRELDLLLGGFAAARLSSMADRELDIFELIVAAADCDLYDWLLGRNPVPPDQDSALMQEILAFRPNLAMRSLES